MKGQVRHDGRGRGLRGHEAWSWSCTAWSLRSAGGSILFETEGEAQAEQQHSEPHGEEEHVW